MRTLQLIVRPKFRVTHPALFILEGHEEPLVIQACTDQRNNLIENGLLQSTGDREGECGLTLASPGFQFCKEENGPDIEITQITHQQERYLVVRILASSHEESFLLRGYESISPLLGFWKEVEE